MRGGKKPLAVPAGLAVEPGDFVVAELFPDRDEALLVEVFGSEDDPRLDDLAGASRPRLARGFSRAAEDEAARFGPPVLDPQTGRLDLTDRATTWLLVATAGYVAASIMANVMSARILRIGPSWASFAVDAGTLTYPLTFTLRDLVHKVGGRRVARTVIVATAALNVLLALGLWATAVLPGDPSVDSPAQTWFGPVLTPVLRITLASIVAQVDACRAAAGG
jgi:hypothetical protein